MGRINSSNNHAQNRRQIVMRSQEMERQNETAGNKLEIPEFYASTFTDEEAAKFMGGQNSEGGKVTKAAEVAAANVEPNEQENPKEEFQIYADAKLNDLNKQIDAEKRPLQKRWMEMKRNRFTHKKDHFIHRMDKHSSWETPGYSNRVRKEFHDYDKVLEEKRQEVKKSISETVSQINVGLVESINKMTQAVQAAGSDASKAQALLTQAQEGLAAAKKGRDDAAKVLSGEENEQDVLAQYDAIIQQYETLVNQLQKNLSGLSGDQSSLQSILDQLNMQKTKLDKISTVAAGETNVVRLVQLQEELKSLQGKY